MKKRERIEKLEEMIMDLAARLECQRRRIDELAARVAEREIVADRDTRYMAYVARKAAKAHRRIDALEQRRVSDAPGSAIDWESARRANTHTTATPCPACGQDRTLAGQIGYHDVSGFYDDDAEER